MKLKVKLRYCSFPIRAIVTRYIKLTNLLQEPSVYVFVPAIVPLISIYKKNQSFR